MTPFLKSFCLALCGLLLSSSLSLAQTCAPPPACGTGQASKWNGSGWTCSSLKSFVVQNTCASGSCTVQCPEGSVVTGGGWSTFFAENMDWNGPSGNGWAVGDSSWKDDGHGGTTVYAVCLTL